MSRLKREEHGISLDVWNARPYIRWETDHLEPIRDAYADLSTKGFMTKVAKQWGGYLITRHAPPLGLEKIYAEIRPDEPVYTGPPIEHYHGDAPALDGLPARHVHSAHNMQWHIKNHDDHIGANSQCVHKHHDPAKYVFPPTPKIDSEYHHDHDAKFRKQTKLKGKALENYLNERLEKLAKHLHWSHEGADVVGRHSHSAKRKDPERDLAKRIDVHPLALPKFKEAEVVFFVIEGCVKADAVLSAGAAVFSVPSVTLWDATELPEFAKQFLVGKAVVIVPDMDWKDKSEVMTQSRLCQTRLRRLGINACVAAPPVSAGKKGPDDFLAAGGQLADLDVIHRDLGRYTAHYKRIDQAHRNAEVFMAIAMHADSEGRISVPLRTIARIMGMDPKKVERALRQLESMDRLSIDGDLGIAQRGWVSRNFYSGALDWEERPTIVIAEHFRAIDSPPIRLEDFLLNIGKKLK